VITSPTFAGKRYAVLGLARSGLATVEALVASGAEVVAWDADADARAKVARLAAIADPLEMDLAGFNGVVVSPGVPINRHPIAAKAREAGVPLIGDIELFAQARASLPTHKVVGITGTNGKSTTTALIHHILQTAGVPSLMGGNIGLPILSRDPLPEGGVYVLELSSYQIDLTFSLDCDVAVLLNITPDHLDRYDGFEAYAASKARLFEMQSSSGTAVNVGMDEPSRRLAERFEARSIETAVGAWASDGVSLCDSTAIRLLRANKTIPNTLIVNGDRYGAQADFPALQGPHNAANLVAAMAACYALLIRHGVDQSDQAWSSALESFPGLPHRMERVAVRNDVLFVNDSKATNATATAPALAAYSAVHWILGGIAKTKELDACVPYFGHVKAAYTIGEAGEMFAELLSPHMPVARCETLERAVSVAAQAARAGETVLLSPACASFDQFKDYEARGDAFRAIVGALK
jgi:UDP-N-acetylmuramoylalanine--D-glutamate ligase